MFRLIKLRRFCSSTIKRIREQRKKEAKKQQDPKGVLKIWEAPTEHPAKRIQRLERRASDRQLEKFAKLTRAKTIESEVFPFVSLKVSTLSCSLRLQTDYLDYLKRWRGSHFFADSVELLMAALTHSSFVHHVIREDHEKISQQAALNVLGAYVLKLSLFESLFPSKERLKTFSGLDIKEIRRIIYRCDSLASSSTLTKLALDLNLPFLIRRFPADPRAVAGKPPVVGLSPTELKGLNSVLCESIQALVGAVFLLRGLHGSVDFIQEFCNPVKVVQSERKDIYANFLSTFTGEDFDPRKRSHVLLLDPEATLHDLLNRLRVRKKKENPDSKVNFDLRYRTLESNKDSGGSFAYMVSLECGEEILATGAADSEAGAKKAAARAVISLVGGENLSNDPMDEAFHPVHNTQVPKPGNYSSRASAFRCLKMFEQAGLVDSVSVEVRHVGVGSRFLRLGHNVESTGTITGIVRVGSKTYESSRQYETESQAKDAAAELAIRDICFNLSASSHATSSSVGSYSSQFRWLHETSRFCSPTRQSLNNVLLETLHRVIGTSNYLAADEKGFLSNMPPEFCELTRQIGRITLHLWGCVEYTRLHGLTGWQENVEKYVKECLRSQQLRKLAEVPGTCTDSSEQSSTMEALPVLEAVVGCLYLSRGCEKTIELLHGASIHKQ
ncbi:hypothetical protein GpartN1_g5425.t1 [Galdieria partita]|uniref:RNase III domain-containing protein n=1 Tax=Galdieria partita TaxID=83374 RepID=A0A9C7PZW2_9RHOD|nr:hypothetical protein GpartN1_g5425.t1 [Galdieria partita]